MRVFVPWGLYATVGEWNFCKNPADPAIVIGENFYMTDEHIHREMFNEIPWNDLKAPGVTMESYVAGDLEDWIPGALSFDGESTFCVLADKDLKSDYERTGKIATTTDRKGNARRKWQSTRGLKKGQPPPKSTYPGEKRRTVDMGVNNFLLEVYLKTKISGATLVSKLSANAGYILDIDAAGRPRLTVKAAGTSCTRSASAAINDGEWHHVVAEVDRSAREGLAVYIDGRPASGERTGAMPGEDASLSNEADFLVGKGPSGKPFAGAMDFLRVCRGTLDDAETTIEELYAWQFDGPQFGDFTGRRPADGKRDAGAIEFLD